MSLKEKKIKQAEELSTRLNKIYEILFQQTSEITDILRRDPIIKDMNAFTSIPDILSNVNRHLTESKVLINNFKEQLYGYVKQQYSGCKPE